MFEKWNFILQNPNKIWNIKNPSFDVYNYIFGNGYSPTK